LIKLKTKIRQKMNEPLHNKDLDFKTIAYKFKHHVKVCPRRDMFLEADLVVAMQKIFEQVEKELNGRKT